MNHMVVTRSLKLEVKLSIYYTFSLSPYGHNIWVTGNIRDTSR